MTTPKAKKVCAKDMADKAVLLKYADAGWQITAVKSAINDFIAHKQKDNKLHFIQVYNAGDARHEQLAKNTFIQNAFSNNAVPVFAVVTPHKKADNTIEFKVVLTDANTDSRIIVGRNMAPKHDSKKDAKTDAKTDTKTNAKTTDKPEQKKSSDAKSKSDSKADTKK